MDLNLSDNSSDAPLREQIEELEAKLHKKRMAKLDKKVKQQIRELE